MVQFVKDILLPAIAILLSAYAIHQTAKTDEKANQAIDVANRISNGQIELNIASLIIQTENRVMDLSLEMSKFFTDEELTPSQKKQLDFLKIAHKQAVESNLNAYEEACAKYLDEKTDKERFKRMYYTPIRRLVESDELKDNFDPVRSSFKCILKVYKQWFDLEQ